MGHNGNKQWVGLAIALHPISVILEGFAASAQTPLSASGSRSQIAVDAHHVQQQWLSCFENLDHPRPNKQEAPCLI